MTSASRTVRHNLLSTDWQWYSISRDSSCGPAIEYEAFLSVIRTSPTLSPDTKSGGPIERSEHFRASPIRDVSCSPARNSAPATGAGVDSDFTPPVESSRIG